ncbi:MAG: hypothetical protein K8R69_01485 [Deltaproteobacteria bacterium]|nr:hypothetical protein [Deltaproteobacteria bacterium]
MEFRVEAAENTAYPQQALEVYAGLEPALSQVRSALDQRKIDALLTTLGNSNFLARWARRHPEKAAETLCDDLDVPRLQEDFFAEFRDVLGAQEPRDAEQLAEILLDRKYRHLFRITLRDVGLRRPLREIVAEFSALARAVLRSTLDWHLAQCRGDFGTALASPDFDAEIPFCILAMGKLGGDELNFSSDIDLIYFYGTDEGRVEGVGGLNPHEYFGKLAERMGAFLRKKNPDGFLYRVDLELRPEGKSGRCSSAARTPTCKSPTPSKSCRVSARRVLSRPGKKPGFPAPISICAPWSTGYNWRRKSKLTNCPNPPKNFKIWPGAWDTPSRTGAKPSRRCSPIWRGTGAPCRRFLTT